MEHFEPKSYLRTVEYFDKKLGRKVEKQILDSAPRLAWFRSEYPADTGWCIVTTPTIDSEQGCQYRADVISPAGQLVATGHKFVKAGSFENYREKAETQAIARALAHAGYGTIYALELAEDDADSSQLSGMPDTPVTPVKQVVRVPESKVTAQATGPTPTHELQLPTRLSIPSVDGGKDVQFDAESVLDNLANLLTKWEKQIEEKPLTESQLSELDRRLVANLRLAVGDDEELQHRVLKHLYSDLKAGKFSELTVVRKAATNVWLQTAGAHKLIRQYVAEEMQPA
jgi:hypothetical protein